MIQESHTIKDKPIRNGGVELRNADIVHSREDRNGERNTLPRPLAKACNCDWKDNNRVGDLCIPGLVEYSSFSRDATVASVPGT